MATVALPFPATAPATRAHPKAIAAWLFAVAALVFAMVVVGGITRLTESGLSIVKWNPIGGMVPPLSRTEWDAMFALYKASPQYQLVNSGMTLSAFKGIFFWEWLHRLLGMSIGIVFAVPLATFAALRWIPRGYGWRLVALLALGGLQGAVGWWMVASGLVDRPSVTHERLAVHLVNALILMSGCIWTALSLRESVLEVPVKRHPVAARPTVWIVPFLALLTVQIVWGAFTAGLRAGHASDTWPLMFDQWVPPLASIIDDPVSVQFVHRTLAYAVALAALAVATVTFRAGAGRRAMAMGVLIVLQVALGIATIVHGVPIALAAAHQACAALLLASTIWTAHWSLRGGHRSLRGARR
ncbi:COX15/CtaA family protein [Glacieibacterium megasporae]|uniref:COX15/CtaA family protein n=1 Tax=Glacieibacterium megasporae TaxID=2835787 RepID=UPI001C1E4E33|nr:COX15/CtaA family protein [Polymorphobacter megasporae]UAJ10030.1 COX15/CtaA family protein [Polymorphobacter megasporae]